MNLKHLLLAWGVLLTAQWLKAQKTTSTAADNTVTTLQQPTDPLRLTHLYAGGYAVGTMDKKTLEEGLMPPFWSIRAGWEAQRDISEKVAANAVVAYDKTGDSDGKFLHTARGTRTLVEGTNVAAGKIPTAGTQMIGSPVTPGGHFLFTAETVAPLPGAGVKVKQQIGENKVAASGVLRADGIEPSIYVNRGPLSAAAVWDPTTKKCNGGISRIGDFANGSEIFSMAWLKPESFSLSGLYTFPSKFGLFADGQYDRIAKECTHFQIGGLQSLNKNNVGIKLWAGIDLINKNFQTIVFINLSK